MIAPTEGSTPHSEDLLPTLESGKIHAFFGAPFQEITYTS